ncbi:MAG: archaeosortase/exosortase family protein [Flavobacteriales bacterium]|nr:archaeosortase/exosortase family protein [Flavobacteriales bacterium]
MSTPVSGPLVSGTVFKDPIIRFLGVAVLLYLGWYFFYEFFLHPAGWFDAALIDSLIQLSGSGLVLLGYELIPEPINAENIRTIGVQGGHLLWIGDACNGAGLFAVFLIFLVAYPGPWKHKLWYGTVGLMIIHLINVLRIIALSIIVTINYELLNFNHDYTFYVVVYGCVFILWYVWVKRFAPLSELKAK